MMNETYTTIRFDSRYEVSFAAFAAMLNLELDVVKCPCKINGRERMAFNVSFKGLEEKDGGILISWSGRGTTLDRAIKDYCRKLENSKGDKVLVKNSHSSDRFEFKAPSKITYKIVKKTKKKLKGKGNTR